MSIEIRDAAPADAAVIAANNNSMAEETESRSLAAELIGPGVAAFLADANKGRYWVAEDNQQIVGQIAVTYEWSDWRNGMLWWVQSVYIAPEYRRRGIYSALYKHVESLAQADAGVVGIRLYVEKDNARAQSTYEKLGMSMTNYQVMQTLFERDT